MNLYEVLALAAVVPTAIAMALLERAVWARYHAGVAIMGTATFVGIAFIIACAIASRL